MDASMSSNSKNPNNKNQNIVINQNHIYIQQLNVQKNSRSPNSNAEEEN